MVQGGDFERTLNFIPFNAVGTVKHVDGVVDIPNLQENVMILNHIRCDVFSCTFAYSWF